MLRLHDPFHLGKDDVLDIECFFGFGRNLESKVLVKVLDSAAVSGCGVADTVFHRRLPDASPAAVEIIFLGCS